MVDLVASLVALLDADAGIADDAEGRVFGGELPAAESAFMPRRAIVVRPSGGPSLFADSYVQADTQRVDISAYGATVAEATALLDRAAGVLLPIQRRASAGVLIHWVKSAGGFWTGRDPQFGWPRAWRSFQVLHALMEV